MPDCPDGSRAARIRRAVTPPRGPVVQGRPKPPAPPHVQVQDHVGASRPRRTRARSRANFPPTLLPRRPAGAEVMRRAAGTSPRTVLVAAVRAPETLIRGIARHSRKHGWHLVTDMILAGARLDDWTGDGVIAFGALPPGLSACIGKRKLPCVSLNASCADPDIPRIERDEETTGRLAAEHLLRRDHRGFAVLASEENPAHRACVAAFARRLSARGRSCLALPSPRRPNNHGDPLARAEGRRLLVAELRRLPLPAAVFALDDCMAADLVAACLDAGLSVPDDVAVLGTGNSIAAETSAVPLSSVDDNMEEAGRRAAALLERLMDGVATPRSPVLIRPRGVVVRRSTDIVAITDRRVSRAIGYIAENYADPMLSVDTVAHAVGMSRRNIERGFREETSCTINEHIVGVRMREASRILLAHPNARSAEVAARVGIASEGTFFRAFRRFFGTTPRDHRAQAFRSSHESESLPAKLESGRASAPTALPRESHPQAA